MWNAEEVMVTMSLHTFGSSYEEDAPFLKYETPRQRARRILSTSMVVAEAPGGWVKHMLPASHGKRANELAVQKWLKEPVHGLDDKFKARFCWCKCPPMRK